MKGLRYSKAVISVTKRTDGITLLLELPCPIHNSTSWFLVENAVLDMAGHCYLSSSNAQFWVQISAPCLEGKDSMMSVYCKNQESILYS